MEPLFKFRPQYRQVTYGLYGHAKFRRGVRYHNLMMPAHGMARQGYNWYPRSKFNEDHLSRIFGKIHYLTDHAPSKVQARWKAAKLVWRKRTMWHKAGINERL